MTRVIGEVVLDGGSVATVMSPRDGLVLEAVEDAPSDGTFRSFSQAEGPLASYRRTVSVEALGDEHYRVSQLVVLRVGLPWWSWLLLLPLRFSLGRTRPMPVARPGAGRPAASQEPRLPWWAPPQRLDRRQAVVMATLAALVSVQGFLAALLPETLTYAASEMHVGTFGQGVVFASVELSALPALLGLVLADRRGRRSVVLWATGAAAVLSELGGFSTSVSWLTVTQVSAGALLAAAGIAAIVVAVEEVPRGCRAWAVGVLGMAAGFGGGGPLLLLPLAGTGAGGWRWLYWLSLLSLPIVAVCAQQLPESRRWVAAETGEPGAAVTRPTATGAPATTALATGPTLASAPAPASIGLGRPEPVPPAPLAGAGIPATRPAAPAAIARSWLGRARASLSPRVGSPTGRLLLVCLGTVLFALFAAPASQFQTEFLRQQRHYSALGISVLQQIAGSIGALGVLFGGRLADTHGRRPVAVICVIGATASTLWAYLAHSWVLWFATTSSQFFLYATAPVLGVYGVELFATASRARSAGLVAASSAVGGVAGLLAAGALDAHFGTLGPALGALAIGPLLLVLLLLVGYPETAGVDLEELAPSPHSPFPAVAPAGRP
jgi:MFS family permease